MKGIEPIILLLTFLLVFFTGALFAAEHFFNNDAQLFQVLCGLLTAISGALMMRVKPRDTETTTHTVASAAPGGAVVTASTSQGEEPRTGAE